MDRSAEQSSQIVGISNEVLMRPAKCGRHNSPQPGEASKKRHYLTVYLKTMKGWQFYKDWEWQGGGFYSFRLSLTLSVPVRDRIQDYFIISSEKLKHG